MPQVNQLTKGRVSAGDITLRPGNLILPKVRRIPVVAKTAAEIDTGFDLPTKGLVLDVWVDVKVAEVTGTTKTIDVGLLSSESGGDTDGFANDIVTSSTGVKRAGAALTVGGSETFFASTTRGALLGTFLAGANVAGDVGTVYETPHILNGTARSVVYQLGSAATELVADIYVMYLNLGE